MQNVRPIISQIRAFISPLLFASFPEARAGLRTLSRNRRLTLYWSAQNRASRRWQTRFGLALVILSIFEFSFLFVFGWIKTAWLLSIPCVLLGQSTYVIFRTHFMWKELTDLFPGRCARCGYDLRATPARCPECGTIPDTIPISQ